MTDKDHHPLVSVPPASLIETTDGTCGVLSRMSSDVLAIVRTKEHELEQARFRIGEYEFRGADYRQILRWADALGRTPNDVVEVLAAARFARRWPDLSIDFSVVDGRISALVWDFDRLPLDSFTWEAGLHIHALAYRSRPPSERLPAILLPASLRTLVCESMNLEELDLSGVPGLMELYCSYNRLTELDLSNIPELEVLVCEANRLTELDLSEVAGLTGLWCQDNELTQLDLSGVTVLEILCHLAEDLMAEAETRAEQEAHDGVPELVSGGDAGTGESLDVLSVARLMLPNSRVTFDEQTYAKAKPHFQAMLRDFKAAGKDVRDFVRAMMEILGDGARPYIKRFAQDLRAEDSIDIGLPTLSNLHCAGNQLTELDLSGVPELTDLSCEHNPLIDLDISPLKHLQSLWVGANVCVTGTFPEEGGIVECR